MNQGERERLFLELFQQNKASIQRLCWGYLDSPHDAEDLFQEIMANVWNSLPSFRGESKISTWVYRIAVNTALVHRKKWKRGEELQDVADGRPCAQQDLERRERLAMLGFEPVGNTPEEYTVWLRSEMAKWAKVVQEAHIGTQ